SPLYAFKEAFTPGHGLAATPENVLVTLSALFWAITLVISLKYVWVVLRHDNDGEGGVLALTALAHRASAARPRLAGAVIVLGVFAAALFYGDAIITPAISVLSAIEGVALAAPGLSHWVLPITLGILCGLFLVQRHGTGRVGASFGPITLLWFIVLGVLGVSSIVETPQVLAAIDPRFALGFAVEHPYAAFVLMSAVFLALTGGEALYADMGHFGAWPVRVAWYGLVCPALLLNYFGQGALVIRDPAAAANPFYALAPEWFLWPLVVLAAAATVIASQATISGAYSITLQASRLGYLPRIRLLHTSDSERGQIYVPAVNWLMLVAVLLLVLAFGSSGALAAAYGIAVSGTMIVTTLLTAVIAAQRLSRGRSLLLGFLALVLLLECVFFASNAMKFMHGGWFPLVLGALIFLLLTTWRRGSALLAIERKRLDLSMDTCASALTAGVPRVPGTAVYLNSDPGLVPSALLHGLKHFKVMHEHVLFVHIELLEVPRAAPQQRVSIEALGAGLYDVRVRFGFREEPDVPAALAARAADIGLGEGIAVTWVVARNSVADGPGHLTSWRANLYAAMSRQADDAASWFRLPPNQVVELGTRVLL
ncbi:MAG TPA: KUP/HAK/KT family potassium transporter, partial [Xanthomonadales bacterium]|nr:KUP/HAK/KT family potassium transporter [Xanthomonadales bacterium]